MSSGTTIRMNRIFDRDGMSVVVAMDHGLPGMFPLGHLADPEALLGAISDAGADAILTTPGLARRFAPYIGKLGLIIRLDGGATPIGDVPRSSSLIATPEDALRLGADAVAVMGFCGTDNEAQSLATLGRVATECRSLELPVMAEMLPLGFGGNPTVEEIAMAARIGAEMGADIIKTKFSGSQEEYRQVTETCFAPVLILGGSERELPQVTTTIGRALAAGAAGVAIGRSVWRSNDVRAAVNSIVTAVHGNTAVSSARVEAHPV